MAIRYTTTAPIRMMKNAGAQAAVSYFARSKPAFAHSSATVRYRATESAPTT